MRRDGRAAPRRSRPGGSRASPRRGARGTVSVALVSDARIRALNRRYRRQRLRDRRAVVSRRIADVHASSAPVSAPRHLGDIVIARGVARRQARAAGHGRSGPSSGSSRLHGLLHLLGYDHERDSGQMARVERRLRRKGGLREGADRAADDSAAASSCSACAAVYLGAIEAAFSALMRLSLRLVAERSDRPGHARRLPRRSAPAVRPGPAAARPGRRRRRRRCSPRRSASTAFRDAGARAHRRRRVRRDRSSCCCRCCIVGRDPERVLEMLLPSFTPLARALGPVTRWTAQAMSAKRSGTATTPDRRRPEEASEAAKAYLDTAEQEGLIEGEERRLLQSIVDFGDTLVREVMTPRPDIVAHPGRRDDRRPARAVPRAGILAVSRSSRRASTTSPASSS